MYKATIGLEIHTELNTNSKIFSTSVNGISLESNVNVSPLDLAFPGTLPVLNKAVLLRGIKLAKILNMDIARTIIFDRKNYYYPDLPKGYQITQQTLPIGLNGTYKLLSGKNVRITDIHIEEDTAKFYHDKDYSTLDFNRCGVPLIEIVTEPDFTNPDEVVEFLEELKQLLKNANISEAEGSKGQIRCDANVSVSKDENFGTKVEIKNINSINNVKKAINSEINRQTELLENGNSVEQETRRYDEDNNTTIFMRSKADAIDYKYFVEPNIPIFSLPESYVEEAISDIGLLPNEVLNKYINDYGITEINARKIIKDINLINYFDECINLGIDPKAAINLITGPISEYLNNKNMNIIEYSLKPTDLKYLTDLNNNGELSNKQMKEVILNIHNEELSVEKFISKHKLVQISDREELKKIINKVIEHSPKELAAYKSGRTKMKEYFLGSVMKETKGNCNPIITREVLEERLSEL